MTGQTIEQLQQRYQKFSDQRIRVQAQLEEAQKRLRELEQQATEQFGSADVGQLQQKLEKLKSENEKKQIEYQKNLDEVEAKLAEVESGGRSGGSDEE